MEHKRGDHHSWVVNYTVNSYNPNDSALNAMVFNDNLWHYVWLPDAQYQTYTSWALSRPFRYPNRLAYYISRNPDGTSSSTIKPLGQLLYTHGNIPNLVNFPASENGWDSDAHSNLHDKPLQDIHVWYKNAVLPYIE